MDRILVVAEQKGGEPLGIVLELLTAARSFGGDRRGLHLGRRRARGGGDPRDATERQASMSAVTSEHRLPGPRVAAAIAALIEEGGPPDAILVGTTYDGRDIAGRLSARLDRPVLTNVVGLTRQRRRPRLRARHLRWLAGADGPLHRRSARASSSCGRSRSPQSRLPTAARPRSSRSSCPRRGRATGRGSSPASWRSSPGPKLDDSAVVVSGGQGPRLGRELRPHRRAGEASEGSGRRLAGHRRRRLGARTPTRSARPARP